MRNPTMLSTEKQRREQYARDALAGALRRIRVEIQSARQEVMSWQRPSDHSDVVEDCVTQLDLLGAQLADVYVP